MIRRQGSNNSSNNSPGGGGGGGGTAGPTTPNSKKISFANSSPNSSTSSSSSSTSPFASPPTSGNALISMLAKYVKNYGQNMISGTRKLELNILSLRYLNARLRERDRKQQSQQQQQQQSQSQQILRHTSPEKSFLSGILSNLRGNSDQREYNQLGELETFFKQVPSLIIKGSGEDSELVLTFFPSLVNLDIFSCHIIFCKDVPSSIKRLTCIDSFIDPGAFRPGLKVVRAHACPALPWTNWSRDVVATLTKVHCNVSIRSLEELIFDPKNIKKQQEQDNENSQQQQQQQQQLNESDNQRDFVWNLTFLEACGNNVDHIPPTFKLLVSLKEFIASSNKIQKIENLENSPNLQVLNFSENQIHSLANIRGLFTHLRVLILSNNDVESTYGLDVGMDALQVLDLQGNKIAVWDEVARIRSMPSLTSLSLANNPIMRHYDYRTFAISFFNHKKKFFLDGIQASKKELSHRTEDFFFSPSTAVTSSPFAATTAAIATNFAQPRLNENNNNNNNNNGFSSPFNESNESGSSKRKSKATKSRIIDIGGGGGDFATSTPSSVSNSFKPVSTVPASSTTKTGTTTTATTATNENNNNNNNNEENDDDNSLIATKNSVASQGSLEDVASPNPSLDLQIRNVKDGEKLQQQIENMRKLAGKNWLGVVAEMWNEKAENENNNNKQKSAQDEEGIEVIRKTKKTTSKKKSAAATSTKKGKKKKNQNQQKQEEKQVYLVQDEQEQEHQQHMNYQEQQQIINKNINENEDDEDDYSAEEEAQEEIIPETHIVEDSPMLINQDEQVERILNETSFEGTTPSGGDRSSMLFDKKNNMGDDDEDDIGLIPLNDSYDIEEILHQDDDEDEVGEEAVEDKRAVESLYREEVVDIDLAQFPKLADKVRKFKSMIMAASNLVVCRFFIATFPQQQKRKNSVPTPTSASSFSSSSSFSSDFAVRVDEAEIGGSKFVSAHALRKKKEDKFEPMFVYQFSKPGHRERSFNYGSKKNNPDYSFENISQMYDVQDEPTFSCTYILRDEVDERNFLSLIASKLEGYFSGSGWPVIFAINDIPSDDKILIKEIKQDLLSNAFAPDQYISSETQQAIKQSIIQGNMEDYSDDEGDDDSGLDGGGGETTREQLGGGDGLDEGRNNEAENGIASDDENNNNNQEVSNFTDGSSLFRNMMRIASNQNEINNNFDDDQQNDGPDRHVNLRHLDRQRQGVSILVASEHWDLYCKLHGVFQENDESLINIFYCNVVKNIGTFSREVSIALVISNRNIYILQDNNMKGKTEMNESVFPKLIVHPCSTLRCVQGGFGFQYLRCEFDGGKSYLFLLREEKMTKMMANALLSITSSTKTSFIFQGDMFLSKLSDLLIATEAAQQGYDPAANIKGYFMAYILQSNNYQGLQLSPDAYPATCAGPVPSGKVLAPCSVFVTDSHIFLCDEQFPIWPAMTSTIMPYFRLLRMEEIMTLSFAEHSAERNQLKICFVQEDDEDEIDGGDDDGERNGNDDEDDGDLSDGESGAASKMMMNSGGRGKGGPSEILLLFQHPDAKARMMACISDAYKSLFRVDLEFKLVD